MTTYDGLDRSYGVTTYYSGGSNIAMASTITYNSSLNVPGISGESANAYEQTVTLDSYHHQSITYTDALGRVRYTQVFSGTGSYSMVRTVGDGYDILGDVTAVNTYDAAGTSKASYTATFDAVKRLTGYNDSDLGSCNNNPSPPGCQNGSAWNFSYDADGNQLSQTDPRNQSSYASYDNLDRPLCRGTTWASVNPCQNSTYALYFYDSYNNTSNPTVTFPSGCSAPGSPYTSAPAGRATAEVFSSSAGSGWRCYGYDQRGELDQNTLSVTADGTTSTNTMNMSYNDGGELASLVYPDQETLTSQYDSDGHLLSVYFGSAGGTGNVTFLVGQASYTNEGLLSGLAMGGMSTRGGTPTPVLTTSYGYDGIQRPQSGSVTVGSNTIWSQARTYDNVGNVLQLATTVPTLSGGSLTDNQSFCYDALDRLVWAGNTGSPSGGDHCGNAPTGSTTPTYQQPLSYDNMDRMTSGPSGSMTYDPNHVHAADTASSFPNQYASYDAMGNMTCRNVDPGSGHTCAGGQSGALMTYDNEGRLSTWTAPSGTTATDSFLYDNQGNRVLQRTNDSNGITDTITFDGYLEIVLHNGSTTTTKYYNVGGQRVAMRMSGTLTNPLYYLVNDSLGGTSLVLTSGGGVQAVQLYMPYGAVRYSQGTVPTTYNYTGQRLDSETGLLYYGFRYYDPVVGRFVRADSVETNARGMDGYGYVGENPETLSDPTGHFIVGAGDGNQVTRQEQQQYDYHYATSQSLGESGLPVLLDMYLYHHDVWIQVESYAQEQLHSSTRMLLALEASMLIHAKGMNWNANNTTRQLFLEVNGLGLPVALAAAGLGMEGGEMATAMDVEKVAAESEQALAENVATDEGGPCSFTPATLVTTEHGKQAIGSLQVGEEVLAYNPKTHKMEEEPILHVWINHDNDLIDLTLTTMVPAQHGKPVTKKSEVIHTNQKHPFFTEEKGFVPVGQITLGMHILRGDGSYGVVTGWKIVPGAKVMYNLEVAQDHTYTVGQGQWVVHNSQQCSPQAIQNADNIVTDPEGRFAKYNADYQWSLKSVDGPHKIANPPYNGYPHTDRYYLRYSTWDDGDVVISANHDPTQGDSPDAWDAPRFHFASDEFQPNPSAWGDSGYMRSS